MVVGSWLRMSAADKLEAIHRDGNAPNVTYTGRMAPAGWSIAGVRSNLASAPGPPSSEWVHMTEPSVLWGTVRIGKRRRNHTDQSMSRST